MQLFALNLRGDESAEWYEDVVMGLGVGEDTQLCDLVHILLGRFLDTEAHLAVSFESKEGISQRKAALDSSEP